MLYIPVSMIMTCLVYIYCCILAAAVIMFLCYVIYMNVFSFLSDAAASTGLVSMTIKRVCAVVGGTAFVSFVFMSILSTVIVQNSAQLAIVGQITQIEFNV